jgi:hypothetical protein
VIAVIKRLSCGAARPKPAAYFGNVPLRIYCTDLTLAPRCRCFEAGAGTGNAFEADPLACLVG